MTDKDGILSSGSIIPNITDINWYEIIDGIRTKIDAANTNYSIRRDNTSYNGTISIVKNNVKVGIPVTLEFNGNYLDKRNNGIVSFQDTVLLRVTESADAPMSIKLDSGTLVKYNPLEDHKEQLIKAQVYIGENLVTDSAKKKFWWYVVDNSGKEEEVTGTNNTHFWYLSGSGSDTLKINRENIVKSLHLRCKGEYITGLAPTIPTNDAMVYDTIISREYPKWEEDIITPSELNANQKTGYIRAEITTGKGVLDNPEEYFFIKHFAKPVTSGATFKEIGHGEEITYDAAQIDSSTGKAVDLAIDVQEKTGYTGAATDDGTYLTDDDGNIYLIR